jgi:hypothetical protein
MNLVSLRSESSSLIAHKSLGPARNASAAADAGGCKFGVIFAG